AGALPRRRDRMPQAVQHRPPHARVLRTEGRAAGDRRPPARPRPEPRRRRARARDGARRGRPRALLSQRPAQSRGARARTRPSPRAREGGGERRSRRGRTSGAERPRSRLRRAARSRRRHTPRRRRPGRLDPPHRQRARERSAPVSEKPKPQRYASWTAGKLPLPELREMKKHGQKIVMVTAYDAPGGRLADAAGVDMILVGDSSGMVVHGRESTVAVSLDEIVFMTQWVTRGAKRPVVVADMPFGSYEVSDEQAVANAVRLVKD